ncbi:MAG: family 43 glycosylhydrolase [Butyrivibrio sp.]|jgi:GH43 family beta-xylosidase|nr:family 43 glycosylhydrolase [Butyrivibrio sp.]
MEIAEELKHGKLVCYTRYPLADEIYAARLAYSMHLGIMLTDGSMVSLNHDYGILFPKAKRMENECLDARSLGKPWIFQMGNGYGVIALVCRTDGSLNDEERGKALFFTTEDFVHFEEHEMLEFCIGAFVRDVSCCYDEMEDSISFFWKSLDGKIFSTKVIHPLKDRIHSAVKRIEKYPENMTTEKSTRTDIEMRNSITLPERKMQYICDKLLPSKTDVKYSRFTFPIAEWRADPCVTLWNGKYYFIATNDADDNRSLYIRCADSMQNLTQAEEYKILDAQTYPHLKGLLWAPEFHEIDGEMYLYHGGTAAGFEQEQCMVTKLETGGNMTCASDWEAPRQIVRKDGSPLYGAEGITLDLTCFEVQGKLYAIWSQRQLNPVDTGAFLYIAQMDRMHPWELQSDPVLLTVPEYAWENNHTFVVEGPYALVRKHKVCVTYSAAAIDTTYTIGLLTAEIEADLLDPSSWRKNNYPLQTSFSHDGEYGPGHNAFVTDAAGAVWNCYHAHTDSCSPRCAMIRPVEFDVDDEPELDLRESEG